MSRNNVFKLSGNMALGSNDAYSNPNDFENIKSSLKLLKSKQQNQKRQDLPLEPANVYGGSYSSNIPTRQPQNSKNVPNYQYQNSYNYPQSNSRNSNQPTSHSYKDIYPPQNNYQSNQYKYKKNQPEYQQPKYQERNQYNNQPQHRQQQQQQQQPTRQQQQQPPRQQQKQQQYNHNRHNPNEYEEKTIKEVNRQNRVQIKQYDPSQYIECGEGCGRKFNPDSLQKHEAICKKVFQKKRKEFNAQDHRIISNDQKKLMKKGEVIEKKIEEKKAKEKLPKWKAQSLQLRSGLRQARNEDYVPTKQQKKILEQAKNDQFTKCNFCGRSFNENAALKHIPFCQSQQKKNQMKKK